MLQPLPKWIMPGNRNAFDDFESATNVEHVARVYKKMQELIEDYNKFVDETNKSIETFEENGSKESKDFKCEIIKIINDYIFTLDMKIDSQDRKLGEAIDFMKDNLSGYVLQVIETMKEDGSLDTVVLTAFDNLGTRVNNLEATEYTLELEPGTENLILVKHEGGNE